MKPTQVPMKITVAIPVYNGANFLAPTLDSLRSQTHCDWNALLIDDGSGDETGAIMANYSAQDARFHVLSQPNLGLAGARNTALRELPAESEALMFLDGDDLLEPSALQNLSEGLLAQPSASATYGYATMIDEQGDPIESILAIELTRDRHRVSEGTLHALDPTMPTDFNTLGYRNCLWTPGQALIRREAALTVGEFDPQISGTADWDYWIRLALIAPLHSVDEPVLRYRRHGHNMSSKEKLMRDHEVKMRRKHLMSLNFTPTQRRDYLAGFRLFEREQSRLKWRLAKASFQQGKFGIGCKLMVHSLLRRVRSTPLGHP